MKCVGRCASSARQSNETSDAEEHKRLTLDVPLPPPVSVLVDDGELDVDVALAVRLDDMVGGCRIVRFSKPKQAHTLRRVPIYLRVTDLIADRRSLQFTAAMVEFSNFQYISDGKAVYMTKCNGIITAWL